MLSIIHVIKRLWWLIYSGTLASGGRGGLFCSTVLCCTAVLGCFLFFPSPLILFSGGGRGSILMLLGFGKMIINEYDMYT
jgi:hypothetical protein